MTRAKLTDLLAAELGWKPGRDRYVRSGREWIPKWRFSPFTSLEDAFQLLDQVADRFTVTKRSGTSVTAEVEVDGTTAHAAAESAPCAITMAVVHALGLNQDVSA
jgi:hypothetical protein